MKDEEMSDTDTTLERRLIDLACDQAGLFERAQEWFIEQGPEIIPVLVQGLENDDLGSVGHWRILLLLRHFGREEALPAVLAATWSAVRRKDPIVLPGAMEALAAIATPAAIEALVQLLKTPDAHVVKHAAALLGNMRAAAAVDALIALLDHTDADVRLGAAEALLQIGARSGGDALRAHLQRETDARIRRLLKTGRGGP
jgi:HEAT repeat protein